MSKVLNCLMIVISRLKKIAQLIVNHIKKIPANVLILIAGSVLIISMIATAVIVITVRQNELDAQTMIIHHQRLDQIAEEYRNMHQD